MPTRRCSRWSPPDEALADRRSAPVAAAAAQPATRRARARNRRSRGRPRGAAPDLPRPEDNPRARRARRRPRHAAPHRRPVGGRLDVARGRGDDRRRPPPRRIDGQPVPGAPIEFTPVDRSSAPRSTTPAKSPRAPARRCNSSSSCCSPECCSANSIEEKSNKVLEVLAASVPIDIIFLGKLLAMLSPSLVGILLWAAAGIAAMQYFYPAGPARCPPPAVGWPPSSRSAWSISPWPIC